MSSIATSPQLKPKPHTSALLPLAILNMPTTCSHGDSNKMTANRWAVSDALTDTKSNVQTTKRAKKAMGGSQNQQRRSASPVTPPMGPCKRTNEHPGHLIRKK